MVNDRILQIVNLIETPHLPLVAEPDNFLCAASVHPHHHIVLLSYRLQLFLGNHTTMINFLTSRYFGPQNSRDLVTCNKPHVFLNKTRERETQSECSDTALDPLLLLQTLPNESLDNKVDASRTLFLYCAAWR